MRKTGREFGVRYDVDFEIALSSLVLTEIAFQPELSCQGKPAPEVSDIILTYMIKAHRTVVRDDDSVVHRRHRNDSVRWRRAYEKQRERRTEQSSKSNHLHAP